MTDPKPPKVEVTREGGIPQIGAHGKWHTVLGALDALKGAFAPKTTLKQGIEGSVGPGKRVEIPDDPPQSPGGSSEDKG